MTDVNGGAVDQQVRRLCMEHGVMPVFLSLMGVFNDLRVPFPVDKLPSRNPEAEPRQGEGEQHINGAPQQNAATGGPGISPTRRRGGVRAWETRRARDEVMTKWGMTREQAALYLQEHNPAPPAKLKPASLRVVKAWETRTNNQIALAKEKGEIIDINEARRRCTSPLRRGRDLQSEASVK
jgi:hypothetical protein